MRMRQGSQCCWRHGIATAETPPPMLQVDCFKIVVDVMIQQGCQCRWRRDIATAETPPPMPQVDCFKIVFDVMMQQGHQCCWRRGVATTEISPPTLQADCFKIVFDMGRTSTTEKHSPQWCRLTFYFSMRCWMMQHPRYPLSHMALKSHQWTFSPTPPVDCFSIFQWKK